MKYLFKTFLIIGFFSVYSISYAMGTSLFLEKNNVAIGEEFYVDVILDTEGSNINGIEGTIVYDPISLEFVRAINSKSFVTHWIENPKQMSPGTISFSGIAPNGFSGFLNDAGPDNAGNITRIVFKPLVSGNNTIVVNNTLTTLNNGEGTMNSLPVSQISVNVGDSVLNSSYNIDDVNAPILTAEIIKDENLYSGEETLIFNAIDKDSGIEGVYIKIKKDWIKINNPYALEGHSFQGILTVKAVDFSGNETIKRFLMPGYGVNSFYVIIFIFIVLTFLSLRFVYRVYVKNKTK